MKKIILGYVMFFIALFLLIFAKHTELFRSPDSYKYHSDEGIAYVSRVLDKQFQVFDGDSNWKNIFVTGVNVGASKPGYFPGDFGITTDDYMRWFQYISDMNVNWEPY